MMPSFNYKRLRLAAAICDWRIRKPAFCFSVVLSIQYKQETPCS
ncbi:Uncharacterised protein [Acinetobacter baumannii]|nr:Uncharacterised protein [Acinetobacter baumannii]SSR39215.1 Uncharacterised protein [Acinetobacter baumannii]SSU47617.1 Uncharacterised protein [Acinetobacter baumannii]SVK02336.1 Uncharacterised protein [Acinetobacter baumannii]